MIDTSNTQQPLPKPGLLRWEIGLALLLKVILLTGLWFVIFRWPERPAAKPDVAQHFALTASPELSSQPKQESRHDR